MSDFHRAPQGADAERNPGGSDETLAGGVHETRRPLALALGYLQMLTDESLGTLTAGQRRAAERIEEKLREARGQLEQLEVLIRLGVVRTEPRSLALGDVVEGAIHRAQAHADLRRASIEQRGRRDVHGVADAVLLDRILDNLLDNALTYSDGSARVVAEIGVDGGPFVRVQDNGRGIDTETAQRVFTKWFRGDTTDSSRPGTGLGLYLSREAAQQMGARLELEWTRPGSGTAFRVNLPAPPDG